MKPLQIAEPDEWIDEPYSMACGSYEAEIRRYKKYVDKQGGVWLVSNQEAAAENVYFHNPKDLNSDGFAGRTLTFILEDDSEYKAKGPWHTNADALFAATGVDIRNTHFTFVVLAKERFSTNDGRYRTALRGIIYKDEKPILGSFNRYKDLIKQHPEANFYFTGSSGGSCSGPISDKDRL